MTVVRGLLVEHGLGEADGHLGDRRVASATGPPSPMFSPPGPVDPGGGLPGAETRGSPGHWWDSPQPVAIIWLCAAALAGGPR